MDWASLLPDDWGSFFYGMVIVWVVPAVVLLGLFSIYGYKVAPDLNHEEFCDTGPDVL